MSMKSKVLAGAAAFGMVAGGLGVAGIATANAATPSCGTSCVELYSANGGSGAVVDVYKAKAKVGQKIILWSLNNTDKAEDFTASAQGTVYSFYEAGLASAALNLHYGNDWAFELDYSPYGAPTNLCVGVATTAASGTPVTLQPCGKSAKTLWVIDKQDETSADRAAHYGLLINGSDKNFSQPFVLTNRNGTLVTNNVRSFSGGEVQDNQLWSANWGIAF
jgi:hypothetical protein